MHTSFFADKTGLRALAAVIAAAAGLLLAACGGGDAGTAPVAGNGPNGPNGPNGAAALQAEIDARFPYVPDQPLDVLFVCSRTNSRLTYYFGFSPNGVLTVFFETDTYQRVSFDGTYTHANGTIRMLALNNPALPLDESSTRIVPHLGMVGEFETPNMRCGAVAHGYNDPAANVFAHYACPTIHAGAGGSEENAFEFNDSASPFGLMFRGGVFRQRDYWATFNGQAIVTRGVGIYRRVGDTFYADFGNQFGDHNLLKGSFGNGGQQLSVEQLEPGAGACARR